MTEGGITMPKLTSAHYVYSDMDKRVRDIARLYNVYRVKVCFDSETTRDTLKIGRFGENEVDYLPSPINKDIYTRFIFAVEEAMKNLNTAEHEIIMREYIKREYTFWWISYYSRSTFYRIKRLALEKFLTFFK